MTSHMHTPYGAPTNRLKGHPPRRYEIVINHGLAGRNTEILFPPRIATQATAQNFLAYSCTVTVLPCTVPRTLTFETVTNTVEYVCSKLSEQVSFAAAMTGKRKADTPQGVKPQRPQAGAPVDCTVCKKNKTTHASKVCLACAQAKKAAGAPTAAAAAPAAAAASPAADLNSSWVRVGGRRNLVPRLLAGAEAGRVPRACLRDLRCHERARQGTVGPFLQLCLYETRVVNS
jgi:hypothetical protein